MTDSLRLFLVEDDDDIALLITKALENAGHPVTRCRTGADALGVLRRQAFDLVLLDHYLHDMSGMDLLQSLGREGIGTPALMVTAYGDEQLATRVLQNGALDYVVKDPALAFLAELPKRVRESVTRHRLQQFNRLLVAALESARDGIVITDRDGTIQHVNQALERLTGYRREELLGQTPQLFRTGAQGRNFLPISGIRSCAGRTGREKLPIAARMAAAVEVSLAISPIADPRGQSTHFVGIHRDITERKQLERQLVQAQKMQSIGTLASGVAHEFNNLLAGITGYASLGLEEPGLSPTLREYLDNVVSLADRAAVDDPPAPRLCPQAAPGPAARCRWRNWSAPRPNLSPAPCAPRSSWNQLDQPGGPLVVEADFSQLQQALVNLALNARDAQKAPVSMTFRLSAASLIPSENGLSRERAARRVRAPGSDRPRHRHDAGGAQPGAGPVFHYQGCRPGNRPRLAGGIRHRSRPSRVPDHRQRPRTRHLRCPLFAAAGWESLELPVPGANVQFRPRTKDDLKRHPSFSRRNGRLCSSARPAGILTRQRSPSCFHVLDRFSQGRQFCFAVVWLRWRRQVVQVFQLDSHPGSLGKSGSAFQDDHAIDYGAGECHVPNSEMGLKRL